MSQAFSCQINKKLQKKCEKCAFFEKKKIFIEKFFCFFEKNSLFLRISFYRIFFAVFSGGISL